jgi:hypothetical protein
MQKRTLIQGWVTKSGVSLTAQPKACRASSTSEVVGGYRPAIVLEAALSTPEELSALAVLPRSVVASWARLRGLARINEDDGMSGFECLVTGKGLGHVERPSLMLMALGFSHLRPLADVGQILEDKRRAWLQGVYEPACGDMQGMSNATPLLARQASQEHPSSRSAFRLQGLAQLGEVASRSKKLSPEEDEPVRGCNHRVMVQVHTNSEARRVRRHNWPLQDNVDIVSFPKPVICQGSSLGRLSGKQRALVVSDSQRKAVTAMQQSQAHSPVSFSEREDALIVGHGLRLEVPGLTSFGFGRLDGIGNTAYGLAREVSTQAESITQVTIDKAMQAVPSTHSLGSSNIKDEVTGISESVKSSLKFWLLFSSDLNLALDSLYEIHNVDYINWKKGGQGGDSSPRLSRVSPRRIFYEPQTTKTDTPWLTISGPFGIFGPHFSGGV